MKPSHFFALIIGKDQEFKHGLSAALKKLQVPSYATDRLEDAYETALQRYPALIFIDLTQQDLSQVFQTIQDFQTEFDEPPPIFIISSFFDSQAITHALEIGASDFLVKPIGRNLLESKLAIYIHSDSFENKEFLKAPVPASLSKAEVQIELKIREMNEFGVQLKTPYLIQKGYQIRLRGNWLNQIIGQKRDLKVTVNQSWIDEDHESYMLEAHFDPSDNETRRAVRKWILEQQSRDSPSA